MEKQNVKDLILLELEQQERPLAWLSRKSEIPYGTLYGILIHRIMNLSDDNLAKINKAMGTDFNND
jgi:predicted transcriptional regulator